MVRRVLDFAATLPVIASRLSYACEESNDMSPAKDLGTRYTCWNCDTKFYDLKRPAPICPKCNADQRDKPAPKPPQVLRRPEEVGVVADYEAEEIEDELETDDEVFEEDDPAGIDEDEEVDDEF